MGKRKGSQSRAVRAALISVFAIGTWIVGSRVGSAESYPTRPIQVVVPFSAGSIVDLLGRGFADALGRALGGTVFVSNHEGASGIVGMTALAKARPDGYTLGVAPSGQITIQPHLKAGLAYTAESFVPICQAFENHFAVVVAHNSPFKNIAALLDAARSQPGKLSWGDAGTATVPNLQMHSLMRSVGAQMLAVPYRNYSQLLQDAMTGQLDAAVSSVGSFDPQNVRVLLMLADSRNPRFPNVPAAKELGYHVSVAGFGGLYAPRGIPDTVRAKLEDACAKVVESESYRMLSERTGSVVSYQRSEAFARRLADDSREKAELLKILGIKAE